MKLYIGLDVSTNCTGVCVINENAEIIKITHCYLGDISGLLLKGKSLKAFLEGIRDSLNDEFKEAELHLAIEEAAQIFKRGSSSSSTISLLNQFNGIVQYISNQVFFVDPILISAANSRSSIGIKLKPEKKCGITTKEQIKTFFENKTKINFPGKLMKSGPRKGIIVFDEKNYDSIDAWVIANSLKVLNDNGYGNGQNKISRKISRKKIRN